MKMKLDKLEQDEARKKRVGIRGYFSPSGAASSSSARKNNKGHEVKWSPDANWSPGDPRRTGAGGSSRIQAYSPSPKAKRKL